MKTYEVTVQVTIDERFMDPPHLWSWNLIFDDVENCTLISSKEVTE